MASELTSAVDDIFPAARSELEDLVRIPSVSAADFDPGEVRRSAEATGGLLQAAGLDGVRLLEQDGAHPAVFGEKQGPPDAPTVLLYAHHDVQPPGPEDAWDGDPFQPIERDGRLYGRGSSDDKCGIIVHTAAIRALGELPVSVKVFVEGEEEIGSAHLGGFLAEYGSLLAADAIVIADASNWRVGHPALTTSLRGLVDCRIEVRALEDGIHSGSFGGAVPDAVTILARILASLHDERGNVAIEGLAEGTADDLDLTDGELLQQAGAVEGLQLIGDGGLTTRLWRKPSVSVLAFDGPPVDRPINQLVPLARAVVSMRLAPGQDTDAAMDALVGHLQAQPAWGARVTVVPGARGRPFELTGSAAATEAFRRGMEEAWGRPPVDIGEGGSIPFMAAFADAYPGAAALLTGVGDPTSRAHGPNESLDLGELRRGILAEALALERLGNHRK